MNGRQRWAALVGTVLVLLTGLFPPWRGAISGSAWERRAGYSFLFWPPTHIWLGSQDSGYPTEAHVDLPMLVDQWGVIVAATGLAVLLLKERARLPPP